MTDTPTCATCQDDGRILRMWARPGGPPGNGWTACPDCDRGRVYEAAVKAEIQRTQAWSDQMNAASGRLKLVPGPTEPLPSGARWPLPTERTADPNPWKETVRDIFDTLHFGQDNIFTRNRLARRLLMLIEERHRDFFCEGKTMAEWEAAVLEALAPTDPPTTGLHTILLSPKAARFAAEACERAAKQCLSAVPPDTDAELDATYFTTIANSIRDQIRMRQEATNA